MTKEHLRKHLIALDLDGTVLNHGSVGQHGSGDLGIEPKLAQSIRTLHKIGHEVVVATGRSVDATLPVVEQLKITPTWVVCANGAVTLKRDALAHRAYRREYVEAFDPTDILNRLRPHLATARFALEGADGTFLYTEEIPTSTLPDRQRQVRFEELLGVQASRVVVVSPDHHLEEFIQAAKMVGLSNVTYAVGDTIWLDIAPIGVSKESALEVILARTGINRSNVFAAGDGRNDIEMLRWAGRYGDSVAMGQATKVVKQAAGRVAPTIDENGLLYALRDRFGDAISVQ